MKKKFIIFFALILLASPMFADLAGYYISYYNFDATLQENNVLSVTETIDVVFTEARHGIYRTLPTRFYASNYEDNDREMTYAEYYRYISTGDDKYTTSSENETFAIKIGDPDKTIEGKHTYTISYECVMPDDRINSYDFFYYSPLGAYWETTINQFDFNIHFEKPIPSDAVIELYSGDTSSKTNLLNVEYSSDSKDIKGSVSRVTPKQAITIYAMLPEGYFIGEKKVSKIPAWILAIITLSLLTYSLLLCLITKHESPVRTVEFYPPKNIPPSEVGFIIDNTADDSDLMALIPYWAQKGYLTITEKKEKKAIKQETYITVTKKENIPDSEPGYMRLLFKHMFAKSDEFKFKNLSSKFLTKLEESKEGLEKEYEGEKALYTNSTKAFALLFLTSIFTILTFGLSSQITIGDNFYVSIFLVPLFFLGFSFSSAVYTKHFRKVGKTIKYILFAFVIALLMYATYKLVLKDNSLPSLVLLIIAVMYSLFCVFNHRIIQMTPFNVEITGKLLGLKEFIKLAEVPRLEVLSEENPEYYYDVLPYAMVFGLSDQWAKKFKTITIKEPDWYSGIIDSSMTFNAMRFVNTLQDNLITPVRATRAEARSKSSGGSGGGGSFGSSGGGGGGGGGGSW